MFQKIKCWRGYHKLILKEAFSWHDECMVRRACLFECKHCGRNFLDHRWAFVEGSGALTWFWNKDYKVSIQEWVSKEWAIKRYNDLFQELKEK